MRTRRALAGLLVAAACVVPPLFAEAQEPKRGGNLRVAYGNEISNLDFYTAPGYELNWVAMNIGCGLLGITPDGKFVPSAAESWQISPDGLLYTFKLRKDVVFHDGTAVDAAAVKFSIDRIMDPATRSSMRTFYESVHSVETLDPHTVQIRLKQPYAFLLHMLAAYRMGFVISSPTATQKYTVQDRQQGKPDAVVGCGPFKLVEWVKGSHLVMDRFDKYFEPGLPLLARVTVRVIKDPVTQLAAFKAGEVDFIPDFSPDHLDTLKAQLAEAGYGPQKPLTFELMTNTEKSVFSIITTVIKEQMARIGVTANIRLTDKVSWMNTATQDGPFDMYVEDLASQLTLDLNSFLAMSTAAWNSARHTDSKVDDYYARYAREMDPGKRKAIAKEFQEFSADKLYWNTISGSPFYSVAQPWMKGYVYNSEFKVLYGRVWLDR